MKNRIINVQDVEISISKQDLDDYICITDIAKAKSDSARAADIVRNWLRNRGTLEFLSVWEQIYNPQFKVFESEHFKKQVGLLTFTPSVSEWISNLNFPHEMGAEQVIAISPTKSVPLMMNTFLRLSPASALRSSFPTWNIEKIFSIIV